MRAKIRQLFCLIVIVIIALAIGAAAINVYMVWGTKGRILKKDQWANFKADGVVVLGCAVRPNKEASPMLNDRMQTAISFYTSSASIPPDTASFFITDTSSNLHLNYLH